MCGCTAVYFFSVSIFEAAQYTSLNSFVENIIISGVQVLATAFSTLLIDKLGRRRLLITSSLLMILALYGLGLYFWYLKTDTHLALKIEFIPLSSLCMFIIAFSIGFGPIPLLLMSELFSPEVKGLASSICSKSYFSLNANADTGNSRCPAFWEIPKTYAVNTRDS